VYKLIKALLLCGFMLAAISWFSSSSASRSKPDDYVGSEACKDCHEDQFKAFSHTS
jgi:hypothetical protein